MFAKFLVSVALVVLSLAISMERAHAMGAMHCEISLDDQQVFRGVISQHPDEPNFEAIRSISAASISATWRGPYSDGPYQDFELRGKVVFAVHGFPTMQLESIRLVYSPFESQGHVSPEWSIHDEDAARIKAFYSPIADRMQQEAERKEQIATAFQQSRPAVMLTSAAVIVMIALLSIGYYVYLSFRTSMRVSSSSQQG